MNEEHNEERRLGRPRKDPRDRRSYSIQVRLSPREIEVLADGMRYLGGDRQAFATWLRERAVASTLRGLAELRRGKLEEIAP